MTKKRVSTDLPASAPRRGAPRGKPFVSGDPRQNAGGRPKALVEVVELARQHTPAAIKALADNLTDENGAVRNVAAQALLDRAWGKAKEHVDVGLREEDRDPLLTTLVALAQAAAKKPE